MHSIIKQPPPLQFIAALPPEEDLHTAFGHLFHKNIFSSHLNCGQTPRLKILVGMILGLQQHHLPFSPICYPIIYA